MDEKFKKFALETWGYSNEGVKRLIISKKESLEKIKSNQA